MCVLHLLDIILKDTINIDNQIIILGPEVFQNTKLPKLTQVLEIPGT